LDDDLSRLNSPNAVNISKLSKRYLETDITAQWSWKDTDASQAATRLGTLICLRGDLAHRGPDLFKDVTARASVRRKDLVDAIALLTTLVERTEQILKTTSK
jgi:hypothetical protein